MMTMDWFKGPIGWTIGGIIALVGFPLILTTINGWYLQVVDAGNIDGHRFDRIIAKATSDTVPSDRWSQVTALVTGTGAAAELDSTTAYKISDQSGKCKVDGVAATGVTTTDAYTPGGSVVKVSATGEVLGCEWAPASSAFTAAGFGPLVKLILQAAGLAPPVAALYILTTFGAIFMRNIGTHPLLAVVSIVILFLIVGSLLNTFIPFLTEAYEAIDKRRFVMYSEGLGNVATLIGSFFGIVTVGSMMTLAWQMIKYFRSGNALGGERM